MNGKILSQRVGHFTRLVRSRRTEGTNDSGSVSYGIHMLPKNDLDLKFLIINFFVLYLFVCYVSYFLSYEFPGKC